MEFGSDIGDILKEMHSKTSKIEYMPRRTRFTKEAIFGQFQKHIDFFDTNSDEYVLAWHLFSTLTLQNENIAQNENKNTICETHAIYLLARKSANHLVKSNFEDITFQFVSQICP